MRRVWSRLPLPWQGLRRYFSTSPLVPFIEKENANFFRFAKKTSQLRNELHEEAVAMLVPEGMSPPELNKGFFYFQRYDDEGRLRFCRAPEQVGQLSIPDESLEEQILSVGELSATFSENGFADIAAAKISLDNVFLGFIGDFRGNERWSLGFRNLQKREISTLQVPLVRNFEWIDNTLTSGRFLYFTEMDPTTLRSVRVIRAELHNNGLKNREVVWEIPPENTSSYVDLFKSKDGEKIFMSSSSKVSSEVYMVASDDPLATPKLIQSPIEGVEYYCEHRDGFVYMVSNKDYINFALYRALSSALPGDFEQVYHSPDLTIRDMDMFRKGLVLYGTGFEGEPAVEIIRFENFVDPDTVPADPSDYARFGVADIVKVPFKGNYAVGKIEVGVNGDFESEVCRFSFRNPRNAGTCMQFRFSDRKLEAVKSREFQKAFNWVDDVTVERIGVSSSDGSAQIPLTLVSPPPQGYFFSTPKPKPCLIHVYGAYGEVLEPDFSPATISLLKRGWIVAYAHVRGGGERGPEWHAAGSKNNRLNSVLDLQSCIQFLIAEKLTGPEITCAVAASAGGVVLGSALNLFGKSLIGGAAILRVPFVNLLNTLKDPSLPLSSHEKDEWGDPTDPTDASFIQSASPIDNLVSDVPEWYPPMLVTCSEDDARVPYEGVVEYAQKLRTITQSRDRLVVRTNRAGEGGHFGSASTTGSYEDTCVELAFLIQSLEDSHQP